jgi:hypothetical protein
VKDYSAGSLLNPQRNPVRAVNGSVSAARRADLLSKKANGDSAVTRNLQAPFLKGLTPEELRAVFAGAEHRTVLAKFRDHKPGSSCRTSISAVGGARPVFRTHSKRAEGHSSLDCAR